MKNKSNNRKPSAFQLLCQAGADKNIDSSARIAIDAAIKNTPQGETCVLLIEQYNEGLITLAKFCKAFIAAALE